MSRPGARLRARVQDLVGGGLGAVFGVVGRVRPADKPMHPRGVIELGRLRRTGGAGTGAAFLDDPGDDEVLVRFSRSLGLPAPWPDVNGLALRFPTPGAEHPHADVLMSTTGRGRWSRFTVIPTVRDRGGFLGTLLPHRSPSGPILLGAHPLGPRTWELVWARPRTGWTPYAVLDLDTGPGRDVDLSFDAVTVGPPGLEVYDWHRRLRGPSYAAARRSRAAVPAHETARPADASRTS